MKAELRALTGARGIAAWLVVLYHIRWSIPALPPAAFPLLDHGYLAVDFFFLLSGFVMWLTWHDRLRGGGVAIVLLFWRKRIARIWPLHLAVLGGAVVLALALLAAGHPDCLEYHFAELPLHVFLVQNWGFTDRLAWNEPAWSISAEFGAYLLFPLLIAAIDWRRVPGWALIGAAAGLIGILHLTIDEPALSQRIAHWGLLRCLTEFAVGTIVSALWLRTNTAPRWLMTALLFTAIAGWWWTGAPETFVAPLTLALLLLLLAYSSGVRGNPLETRVVHFLGEISFATYLSHMLIWRLFKILYVADPTRVSVGLALVYIAIVLAASAALYRNVEKPAQRWVNGLGSGRRPIVPAGDWPGGGRAIAPSTLP